MDEVTHKTCKTIYLMLKERESLYAALPRKEEDRSSTNPAHVETTKKIGDLDERLEQYFPFSLDNLINYQTYVSSQLHTQEQVDDQIRKTERDTHKKYASLLIAASAIQADLE